MRRERLERERQETIADMQQELEAERQALQADRRQQTRNAETPTNEMYTECQELLQLFGIPYIIAPQEAEAQCAYLNEHKLVDGVVTDDSDVFLFGGTHIYKNIFENQKYVGLTT
jgi:DNA excision repair protein ERCC-5